MAVNQTPEQEDAVARARAEVNLLLLKYSRRLKTRAVEIAADLMLKDPEGDPDAAGRRAVAQAGQELKLLSAPARRAILAEAPTH
jgi:hypothetical protein